MDNPLFAGPRFEPVFIGPYFSPDDLSEFSAIRESVSQSDPDAAGFFDSMLPSTDSPTGKIFRFRFSNGYGASVISSHFSFGSQDQWELAVIWFGYGDSKKDGPFNLVDEPPGGIGHSPQGYLSWDDVERILEKIESIENF